MMLCADSGIRASPKEVTYYNAAIAADQDVRRLNVAMYDLSAVRVNERISDAGDDPPRVRP